MAGPVIVEIAVDLAHLGQRAPEIPLPLVELGAPVDLQVVVALDRVPVAQPPHVEEIAGDLARLGEIAPVGPCQARPARAEQSVDLRMLPRTVTELDREPQVRGSGGEEAIENADRARLPHEIRRHLHQQRSQPLTQRLERHDEGLQRLSHARQPCIVGDVVGELGREAEMLRGVAGPGPHEAGLGRMIEGVVELDAVEHLGVEG